MNGRKYKYEEVKSYFSENNCELLSTTYIDSKSQLSYKCSCGNLAVTQFRNFKQGKRCKACRNSRSLETNRKNHGGKLHLQTEEFLAARCETWTTKYGVDSPLKNEYVKKNLEKTNLDRYGVRYVGSLESVKTKRKKTMKERYGNEYSLAVPELKVKFLKTLQERYKVSSLAYLSRVCSKESQRLFWSIQEQLPIKIKEKSHFGELNAEFVVSYKKQCYKYDFVNSNLKKVIEYNGFNFHPKKEQQKEEIGWCAFHPDKTVKEARIYEKKKQKAIEVRGYNVLTVWDYELHQDFEKLVKKCITFLLSS